MIEEYLIQLFQENLILIENQMDIDDIDMMSFDYDEEFDVME